MKKDNKLIVEFMGVDIEHTLTITGICRYLKSWDMLMPVVHKIGKYKETDESFYNRYEITSGHTMINNKDFNVIVGTYEGSPEKLCERNSLDATYRAVIEYIKWYNIQL